MAVKFVNRPSSPLPVVPKPDVVKDYDILDALAETLKRKDVLMLVHKENGTAYQVLSYDPSSGRARLKGSHGERLYPKITAREALIYRPLWRT